VAWAVIPFNDGWVLSNINVALLFIFAVSSLEVYGVIMGGWASNSKYAFLGSLRSAGQMISYEVSLGLIIIGIIIATGSMNLSGHRGGARYRLGHAGLVLAAAFSHGDLVLRLGTGRNQPPAL
jgi:NADH-quinone oxidoreductase subunit H